MSKYLRITVCLVLLFSINLSLIGASVSGVRIVNNTSQYSDFKLSDTQSQSIISSIDTKSDINETFTSNSGIVESNNEVLDYLIENNIISRESKIKFSDKGMEIDNGEDTDLNFNRTDFLMGLYKTVEGVILSRPFVFNASSQRMVNSEVTTLKGDSSDYKPNDGKADDVNNFDEGDYNVYISPNVHELYLVELIDKGVLDINEFKDIEFVNDYNTIQSGQAKRLPEWDNSLQPYYYNTSKVDLDNQLGKAWKAKGIFRLFNTKTENFTLERNQCSFLVNESLTKLEALRYVNMFINPDNLSYDKDKSNEINYLFSNSDISALSDEDKDMVLYFLSLGILNKENLNEVTGFNNPINTDFVLNLFYRIHDVNNRVQVDLDALSEDDKVLMEQGFVRNNVSLYTDVDDSIEPQTLSIERIEPSPNNMSINKTTYTPDFADPNSSDDSVLEATSFKLFGNISSLYKGKEIYLADKDNTVSPDDLTTDSVTEVSDEAVEYKIKKLFPSPDKVEFKNKTISELTKGDEVSDVSKSDNGIVVTFTVKASSDTEALALIDSKLTYDLKIDSSTQLQTVTQVSNDKTVTNYISAREIERSLGELMVMSTKILKNRATGTMAVLLEDNNTAMVGNKVIKTSKPIVIDNTADTYYNLEVIVGLMSNAYLSDIDPGKMFISEDLPNEKLVDVVGTGGTIERATVMNNSAIKSGFFSKTSDYYNVNMLTRAVTSLTRDFLVNGKKVTVMVDWAYSLPNNDKTILNYFKDPELSVKDASEFLFSRPTEGELQEWWDNNIILSNALCNFIYGTENIDYITSGYLKPDLSVLIHDSSADESSVIDALFKNLPLSQSYLNKYTDGSLDDFEKKLFSGTGDITGRRIFYCAKAEDVNNSKVFGNMYIITPTGSVFKNIDQDKRVKYEEGQLKVNGRDSLTDEVTTGTEVILGGKTYYLQKPTTMVDRYWTLTDVEPITGKVTRSTGDTYKFTDENGKDILREEIKKTIKELELQEGEYRALADYKDSDLSSIGSTKDLSNGSLYYANGSVVRGKKFDTEDNTVGKDDSFGIKSGSTAYAFKNIYLDRSLFTVENGEIVRRKSSPYLEQGNVFFSGLNSALMARLIDNQAETVRYADIPTGAQVIIQDYKFIKTTYGLESAPIHDSELTNSLVNSFNDEEAMNRVILAKFTGLQLLFSGRAMPFSSYITTTGIGSLQFEDELANTVYLQNDKLMLGNKDSKVEYSSGGESICIKIILDNDVNFYLLDDSSNTYAMKYTSDKYSDGYIDSISAFNEDLGLGVKDDIFMELSDNVFSPMEGFRDVFNEYKQVYHSMMKGDLIGILQYFALTIIMYLIVMCFVMTMILKGHVGLNILLAIRNPSGVSGKEGFDPVKIFSLGIWDLNSSPNLGIVLIAELGLFLLFYIVLNCGTIIRFMFY